MRQLLRLAYTSLIIAGLLGCQQTANSKPDITGYVVEQSNGNILVASATSNDLSSNGGISNFYDMVWFMNAPSEISLGDKVDVWYDAVEGSYPKVSTIKSYYIYEGNQPDAATLSESEVLKELLQDLEVRPHQLFAVHAIDFNKDNNEWIVDFMEIWTEEVVRLEFNETDQL